MGILTGALFAGLIGYFMKKGKKETLNLKDVEQLHDAKKIAVIGCSGSGKTYLSFKLQEKLQLPLIHLDQYAWKPHWEKVDAELLKNIHHELCKKDAWIMEGIYLKLLHERVQFADAIIFLDVPRSVCLWNVMKRSIFNFGKVIEGNPQGCKLDIFSFKFLEFLQWIWNFNRKHRQAILDTLHQVKEIKLVFVIRSRQEMNDFLKEFCK